MSVPAKPEGRSARQIGLWAAGLLSVFGALSIALSQIVGPWIPMGSGSGPPAAHRAKANEAVKRGALDPFERLPLSFVPNAGQTDDRVRYYTTGPGYGFYFTREEAVLALHRTVRDSGPAAAVAKDDVAVGRDRKTEGVSLALRFVGTDRVAPEAQGVLPGRVNYLVGDDPNRWHTGLPTYGEIIYRDLWPGVDLAFRGEGGQLKYEMVVQPGAEVGDIRLAYRGAERLSLDGQGNLSIGTPLGVLRDTAPRSYQLVGGTRVPLASRFTLTREEGTYGFRVGEGYDPRYPLVIDPGLVYSTYLGGSDSEELGDEVGLDIAVDAAGAAYVTGQAVSPDFPTTLGAFDTTLGGFNDAFVTKLDPSGKSLVYSTYLGGSDSDAGIGIAVDAAGAAYITGFATGFAGSDFPTTPGAFDTRLGGQGDAFVAKLAPSGESLVYSTFLGGSSNGERGNAIAVDAKGAAYVTGFASETCSPTGCVADFPTTRGAFDTTFDGTGFNSDPFVTKLDPTGRKLVYSTYLGGGGEEDGTDIAVDGVGAAYVTGMTEFDFPTTPGAFDTTENGGLEAFVAKLAPSGGSLLYSTYVGGSGSDAGRGIDLDSDGAAYVTGGTGSSDFPTTPGAFDTRLGERGDAFVTKVAPTGASLVYSTYLGGDDSRESGGAIAVDAAGAAYVTGGTLSRAFPTTRGAFDITANGALDIFVTKTDPSGTTLLYSTYLGGSGDDAAIGIAVDDAGAAYVTGFTGAPGLPTTPGAFDTTLGGVGDAFVTKLDLLPRAHP